MRKPFVVFEIEHWTMPDLISTLEIIGSPKEAEEFAEAYEAVCGAELAEHNIRYMLNIMRHRDSTEAQWLADLFMVELPDRELSPRHTFGTSSYGIGEPMKTVRVDVQVEPNVEKIHISAKAPVKKKMKRVQISVLPTEEDLA